MLAIREMNGYKTGHIKQAPDNTEYVYNNFTARSDKPVRLV